MKVSTLYFFATVFLLNLCSCVSHQELLYLKDLPDNADIAQDITNPTDLKIQPDDLLAISVSSYNMEASKPFNPEGNSNLQVMTPPQGSTNMAEMVTGYFVDVEGNVDLPIIGKINVNQKTLSEAKTVLYTKLKEFVKDPVVNIRFLNLKVSVLGEVAQPGTIRLTNKRITIFEALGLAGDMTSYSNRANVTVIREKNGKRTIKRLNLQSSEIFMSPYYYLQQNDVVYVEPNKNKINTVADRSSRLISYLSAGLSIVTLAVAILPKL